MIFGLVAALVNLFTLSIGDSIAKRVSVELGNYGAALFILGIGVLPLLVFFFAVPQNQIGMGVLVLSLVAGVFLAIGNILIYKSLETEQVSETMSLVNIGPALLIIFGFLVLQETVNLIQKMALPVLVDVQFASQ